MSESESRVRTWVMGVRLSARERAIVTAKADALGVTVPEMVRRMLLEPPTLHPGDVVHVAGPDVHYRILGLATSGADATLDLRVADGRDWIDARIS